MKPNLGSRAISAMAIGILFGSYVHYYYVSWGMRGREAFIAHQMQRFDHYMANPQPLLLTILGTTILTLGALALYEAIAFVVSKLLRTEPVDRTCQ